MNATLVYVGSMEWITAAEHVDRIQPKGMRAGRRVAPSPIVTPRDRSTVHAVDRDGITACGQDAGGLTLTPSVPWPPTSPRIIPCPNCVANIVG